MTSRGALSLTRVSSVSPRRLPPPSSLPASFLFSLPPPLSPSLVPSLSLVPLVSSVDGDSVDRPSLPGSFPRLLTFGRRVTWPTFWDELGVGFEGGMGWDGGLGALYSAKSRLIELYMCVVIKEYKFLRRSSSMTFFFFF